jgi:hypothetical protein
MVASLFVGSLVEFPDQLFEGAAHVEVGNAVGMEVDFGKFQQQLEKTVGLIEFLDLLLESEMVEEGTDFGGEAVDVIQKVLGEAIGVGLELFEVVLAGVVELLAGGLLKHFVDVAGALALQLPTLFEDLGFGVVEDAVEAAEHGHGEHDLAVFGRAVGAAEQIGHVPDEVD